MSRNVTEVRLLAVPLENDNTNTLYFSSLSEQTSYFVSRTRFWGEQFSYQRKDQVIRYPRDYDELVAGGVNYVMYRNESYGNKWYFAFVTKLEYINDGRTDIHIETDVIQTWMFNSDGSRGYKVKPSFVEREHVKDDTVGANTVPEGLDTGEYVCNWRVTNGNFENLSIVMGCTLDINNYENQAWDWNTSKEFKPLYGGKYDGLYSGLSYFVLTPEQLKTILKHIAYEGQEEAVHSIFMAPTDFLPTLEDGKYAKTIPHTFTYASKEWDIGEKPKTINGYTPKNNKLLTSPYCYMMVDNGGGTAVEYLYEKFKNDNIKFKVCSVLTPGMSIRAIPEYYNGLELNDSEGINLSKFSTCSWTTDSYTSWLTQSAVNVGLSTVGAVASCVGSVALAPATGGTSLAVGASIVGGVTAVGSSLASANERLSTPPQLHGNTNNGDISTAKRDVTFRCYKMSIKEEFARIIDGYFNMYGYKVNRVKIPNTNHRENYWYTKTINCNIDGNIPMEDIQKIKNFYNNGITFWKNPDVIGDYSVSNKIV
jgi:hypothetical protein